MLLRIALVTTVLVGGMVALKVGGVLERAGLVGSCRAVASPGVTTASGTPAARGSSKAGLT